MNIFPVNDIMEIMKMINPEVTTKISKLKIKIIEKPVSYNGRKYSEGKKIKSIDGLKAIITLIKYRFFK